jgi:hypothetical protein
MTLTVNQYEALKRKAEQAGKEAERAAGAREQLMRVLKDKYGCKSTAEAEKLLAKKQKEQKAAQEKAENLLAELRKEYADELGADLFEDD